MSPNRSATSGRRPARRAAAASARPDCAARRMELPSARDPNGEFVCITKIEYERLVRLEHSPEESSFRLVFHVPDCERAHTDTTPARERLSRSMDIDACNAGRRHRVDVGSNKEATRRCKVVRI